MRPVPNVATRLERCFEWGNKQSEPKSQSWVEAVEVAAEHVQVHKRAVLIEAEFRADLAAVKGSSL